MEFVHFRANPPGKISTGCDVARRAKASGRPYMLQELRRPCHPMTAPLSVRRITGAIRRRRRLAGCFEK